MVGGTIVEKQQLEIGKRLAKNGVYAGSKIVSIIIVRNDDADQRIGGRHDSFEDKNAGFKRKYDSFAAKIKQMRQKRTNVVKKVVIL